MDLVCTRFRKDPVPIDDDDGTGEIDFKGTSTASGECQPMRT